jgi:hypothetical protein
MEDGTKKPMASCQQHEAAAIPADSLAAFSTVTICILFPPIGYS